MRQHVNFLKSLPNDPRELSGRWIILSVVLSLLVLFAVSGALLMNQWIQFQHLKTVQNNRLKAADAFQKQANAYPLFASDTPFVNKVADFEQMVRDTQKHVTELNHITLRHPFSDYLQALAQTAPEGLWLTQIHIHQDSGDISLIGQAFNPTKITLFIQNLQASSAFSGELFDLFDVKKNTPSGLSQFEIANNQLSKKEDAHAAP